MYFRGLSNGLDYKKYSQLVKKEWILGRIPTLPAVPLFVVWQLIFKFEAGFLIFLT